MAALHAGTDPDGRLRSRRRPPRCRRPIRRSHDGGAGAGDRGPRPAARCVPHCAQGVSGAVSASACLLHPGGLRPDPEHADDQARHRLPVVRGLHDAGAQQQDAQGPAPEVPHRRAGRAARNERRRRRRPDHRRDLSALSDGVRALDAAVRKTVEGVFLPPRTGDARQGALLYLASERPGRRVG